jgi:hypothetical protein
VPEATAESRAAAAATPAASAEGTGGGTQLPRRLDEETLEKMSKKELVVVLQQIAAPQVLQAAQLSGNPVNVAKKASKEKVRLAGC